jgi:hypothetical protein
VWTQHLALSIAHGRTEFTWVREWLLPSGHCYVMKYRCWPPADGLTRIAALDPEQPFATDRLLETKTHPALQKLLQVKHVDLIVIVYRKMMSIS